MAVVEIVVKMKDESSGARKRVADDMRDIGQAAGESEGKTSSFWKNAFSFVTGGIIGKAIDGITSSFSSLVGGMVNGNAEFETYQTQFGVLLKSSDAAKQRLQELAEFGAKTPFELPELVRADKVLTAFGLDSADTAQRFGVSGAQIRTTIGDVASGTGTSFEELSVTFGKFASGATGEAIARFQELGIATKEEMAQWGLEFSKSGQLLTPAREAFTILEAHVRDKFGGMMDAQSQTFQGMVSNLQDWAGATLRTMGQPLFEVLKDKLGVLLTFLSSPGVQAGITGFATMLADGIGKGITFVSGAITNLQPVFNLLTGIFSKAGTDSGVLGGAVSKLGGVLDLLQTTANNVMGGLQSIVGAALPIVTGFFNAHGTEISSFFKLTYDQVIQIVKLAIQLYNAIVPPILKAVAGFIGDHKTEITGLIEGAWSVIKGAVTVALSLIQGIIKTALALINGDWKGAWDAITEMSQGVVKGLVGILEGGAKLLGNAAQLGIDAITGVWQAFTGWAGIGGGVIDGIVSGVLGAAHKLIDAVSGAIGDAIQGAKNLLNMHSPSKKAADELGRPFIDGITMGMMGGADDLMSGLNGILDNALAAAKAAIQQFHSLSDFGINTNASTITGAFGGGNSLSIPGFAGGTTFAPGGPAIVGENGPEVVNLPRGAQVTPAGQLGNTYILQYYGQAGLAPEEDVAQALKMHSILFG